MGKTKNRIVVLDGGYDSYERERQILAAAGYDLEIYSGRPNERDGKIEFLQNAVGALVRGTQIDADFLDRAPSLRALVRYGVGYDNIDLTAASQRGIKVAIVRGYGSHAVSEHALSLIFACARALPRGQQRLDSHFGKPPRQPLFQLHDKILGIIGLGNIGGALCLRAQTLFRKIVACDPYVSDQRFAELNAERCNLDAVLAQSHVISLHCNLTAETHNMLDDAAFRRMQQKPILINTARGAIIDEKALLQALRDERIHSAGLDVFADEPPTNPELLNHPNVLATGHYAWYSEEGIVALQTRAAENMLALLQGKTIDDCLNA